MIVFPLAIRSFINSKLVVLHIISQYLKWTNIRNIGILTDVTLEHRHHLPYIDNNHIICFYRHKVYIYMIISVFPILPHIQK